ncbi:hypothetical protein G7Y31_06785 [Corynebacterium lizhenjunii]|uniref:Uncharacterized protein n=1 Tax=Corynebacterium lizhenjunii TaxID=2709394 RepID=A0A7T0KCJ8_9CORY|nr:hypothetical protein [Corynebacterium lizhenjunii]QPK78290.1 hypothetical protein G7Y31_06785 [Corynebacterium lizhenjunii]
MSKIPQVLVPYVLGVMEQAAKVDVYLPPVTVLAVARIVYRLDTGEGGE